MHPLPIPKMSVGNRMIDSELKNMFGVIYQLQQSIRARDCAAIAANFNLLEEFAYACFSVEEKVARSVGFEFAMHNLEHQNLLKKYRQLREELVAKSGTWSSKDGDTYINSVNDCLVNHVVLESKPLKNVLDTYLYAYEPA